MKHACEKISMLVSENMERKLTLREGLRLKIHLVMCAACRHYFENMSKLNTFFQMRRQQACGKSNLPQEKREKIERVLKEIPPET